MKVKGHFKSEAEAYQQIRWHWKKLLNAEQRKISFYNWEAEHQDKHPQIKRMVMASMKMDVPVDSFHMPICKLEECQHEAKIARMKVAMYQNLLNGYKVASDA